MFISKRVRACEEHLRHLDGVDATINEHDDRLDELDRHRIATDAAVREMGASVKRLINGVTGRDMLAEQLLVYMTTMMNHLKIDVPPLPIREPA